MGTEGTSRAYERSRRLVAPIARLISTPRLRAEVGWVVVNKTAEFGLLFLLLKLLTNTLGREGYGEYNLAETAIVLLGSVLLVPISESYMRDFHASRRRGESRASGVFLLRWYLAATCGVALAAAVLSPAIGERFGIGRWTALAAGLVFLFDRWRFLGQEALNIRRERRAWTLLNVGYSITLVLAIGAAVRLGPAQASTALFGFAAAAALFAALVAGPMALRILRSPPGPPSDIRRLALTFGAPLGALMAFQWVQGFIDRYLLKAFLDMEAVGLYVAAYQVCGIPYTLLLRISHNLLTPIAYQRGHDVRDAGSLWAADRLLLAGLAIQAVIGALMLVGYGLFGPRLVVLLTSPDFVVPTSTVVVLAAGRYVQALGQGLQPVFAVHKRTGAVLRFRVFGAILTVAICTPLTQQFGLFGAALGSLLALVLYLVGLVFGPSGCWWMIRRTRMASFAERGAVRGGLG